MLQIVGANQNNTANYSNNPERPNLSSPQIAFHYFWVENSILTHKFEVEDCLEYLTELTFPII